MTTRYEVAAGGVVFRHTAQGIDVLIALTATQEWVLPKGHVEPGESLAATALREIAEEVRVAGRIVAPLGDPIAYTFEAGGVEIHKQVHFFLVEYQGPSDTLPEDPLARWEWVTFEDAFARLEYPSTQAIMRRA